MYQGQEIPAPYCKIKGNIMLLISIVFILYIINMIYNETRNSQNRKYKINRKRVLNARKITSSKKPIVDDTFDEGKALLENYIKQNRGG